MTATNHALAGGLIGAVLPLPLAIPVAFCSHFVMDALPHYGIQRTKRDSTRTYKSVVLLDVILAVTVAALGIYYKKWNMEIAGWAAYAPDILWIVSYFRNGKSLHMKPTSRFMRFHCDIQREYAWGIITETVFAVLMFPVLIKKLWE